MSIYNGGGMPHSRHATAVVHTTILPQTSRPSPVALPPLKPSNSTSSTSSAKARSGQVLVACAACQKRKSKCTGERPRCSLCSVKKTDCYYETRFGEARSTQLKRRVQELGEENQHLKHALNTMRTASERQATNLLLRLRETNDLDEALKMINDSALLLSVLRRDDTNASSGSAGSQSCGSGGDSVSGTEEVPRDKSEIMKINHLLTDDIQMLDPKLRDL